METILYKDLRKKKKRAKRLSKIDGKPLISRQKAQKELDKAFNAYIRARDKVCLMGVMFGGCKGFLTAGHVVPKEDSYNVRWVEDNVFGQCSGHNKGHRYRRSKYYHWFSETHGAKRLAELTHLATQPTKALSRDECLRLTAHYKKLTEAL